MNTRGDDSIRLKPLIYVGSLSPSFVCDRLVSPGHSGNENTECDGDDSKHIACHFRLFSEGKTSGKTSYEKRITQE